MSQEKETGTTKAVDRQADFLVGVRFHPVGKVYHFNASHQRDLRVGDFVVVTTSRGQQIGQVVTVDPEDSTVINGRLKSVDRRATGRDLAIRKSWENKEIEALVTARALNAEIGLPIKLVQAEYSFDGKQLTIFYSAEERKETKALRKRLSRAFRARVELRQVGPRDEAKILGGYGACGGPRCCSSFLTEFSPISIRMAKAQGVSLNPSEITGMCGRLRCCLIYEYEQYVEARKNLPKQGKRVGTPHGEGKVISLFPLKESALIDLGPRRLEVHREDILPLVEWHALQQKTAQECDKIEKGRQASKKPKGKAGAASRRTASQRDQAPRPKSRTSQKPKKPDVKSTGTDADRPQEGKSSRRKRRRRRRR